MIRYLADRLLQSLVVLAVMSFVVYVLLCLMPGDPIDIMMSGDPKMTAADRARLAEDYGLDRPILERYGTWLKAAVSGDLGWSRTFRRPVLEILLPRLGNTILLMGAALGIALMVGLPLGIWAGSRAGGLADRVINLACFATAATPTFWLALLLMILFAVKLGWFPASGLAPRGAGFWESLRHLVLPVVTLAIVESGIYARHMRAAMIEALQHDYVRTARAKGATRVRVILVHALRNALLPVTTVTALGFGSLFSGALITETMFAWPGMGKLIFESIMSSDFNVALVALLFATLVTLLCNLAADLSYVALDPRISIGHGAAR